MSSMSTRLAADTRELVRAQKVRLSEVGARPYGGGSLRGRYDAAQTVDGNRRHWAMSDGLSPAAGQTPAIRRTLRNRARYETANNSYAAGMKLTVGNDTVGTGPRVQMLTDEAELNDALERSFAAWADETELAAKLRTLRMARMDSGEGFAVMAADPGLRHVVKLNLRLIEADQIAMDLISLMKSKTSLTGELTTEETDGIEMDDSGRPRRYWVLKGHPGGQGSAFMSIGGDGNWVDAKYVLHFFRRERPGQVRGIPEITPALGLFAQLRRYTIAVLEAAETAAGWAAVLKSDSSADADGAELSAEDPQAMDQVELQRRMATVLPRGWDISQVKAEQPTTTYGDFKREILNEIARCLNMPFNVAAGNSASYNYASGRLDHQTYFKAIKVDRSELETLLDRLFEAFITEQLLVWSVAGDELGELAGDALKRLRLGLLDWAWFWPGNPHVDPVKEAAATETRLKTNTTTLAEEYAVEGKDWEKQLRQRGKELKLMKDMEKEFGISFSAVVPGAGMPNGAAPGGPKKEEPSAAKEEDDDDDDQQDE
jgi:capsid protein